MNIGIVIHGSEAETVWNAFRYGTFAQKKGDSVRVFLIGKGVESEHLHSEKFPVRKQMQEFDDAGGEILACGTCLEIRQQGASDLCPVSTLSDLHEVVHGSDRLLTF